MRRLSHSLSLISLLLVGLTGFTPAQAQPTEAWKAICTAPTEWQEVRSLARSPLLTSEGKKITRPEHWDGRRKEIYQQWTQLLGPWPPLLPKPRLEIIASEKRESFTQQKVRLEIAPDQFESAYLLTPEGDGPFPAIFVPFYEPETSIGTAGKPLRDFAYQLTKRGFVTLSVGSPGGDARKPVLVPSAKCQPLSYLAYIAANGWQTLANLPQVDAARIGIVGHSYGGKWAMFAACLWDRFACAAWSDPGILFEESRASINYQEPWYLGWEEGTSRKPGLVTPENPRTGAYRILRERGHDLVEFQSLMAPRPFLVSGGAEDPPKRWAEILSIQEVYSLLGFSHRVGMTNREKHDPTESSNAAIYDFFELWLKK